MPVLIIGQVDATIFAAFAAGFVSFVSPCVLPLVPGYLSAISGMSGGVVTTSRQPRSAILVPATIFCLSFTAIFVAIGMLTNGLSAPLRNDKGTIEEVAGIVLIALGLLFIATPFVRVVNREWRPDALLERAGTGGPLVAGAAFAIGWTPCNGPILAAVLAASAERSGVAGGAFLLLAYSLGLAVPFLLSAVAFERVTGSFGWLRDHYTVITVISGVILVVAGVLVYRHEMTRFAGDVRDLMSSLGLDPVIRWVER
jgi:cytochrome c-type biogenesis protein